MQAPALPPRVSLSSSLTPLSVLQAPCLPIKVTFLDRCQVEASTCGTAFSGRALLPWSRLQLWGAAQCCSAKTLMWCVCPKAAPVRRHLQQPRPGPGAEAGPHLRLPGRGQHARAALRPPARGATQRATRPCRVRCASVGEANMHEVRPPARVRRRGHLIRFLRLPGRGQHALRRGLF